MQNQEPVEITVCHTFCLNLRTLQFLLAMWGAIMSRLPGLFDRLADLCSDSVALIKLKADALGA
jgi:hypothetical protein